MWHLTPSSCGNDAAAKDSIGVWQGQQTIVFYLIPDLASIFKIIFHFTSFNACVGYKMKTLSNSSNTGRSTLPRFQSPRNYWDFYRDFTGISKSDWFLKRRASLMHEGFVIQVKSDVEYLNWLLKSTSTLKYFKGNSSLKSTVLLSLMSPAFPWESFKTATYCTWRQFYLHID